MRLDRMCVSMLRAYLFGTGPGTVVPGGLHAFIKTRADLAVPDVEFMFHTVPPQTRLWLPLLRAAYQDAYAIRPTLLHPQSRGEVLLRSADPMTPVRVRYNFFSVPDDLRALREAFRIARRGRRAKRDGSLSSGRELRRPRGSERMRRSTPSSAGRQLRRTIPPERAGSARTARRSSILRFASAASKACG